MYTCKKIIHKESEHNEEARRAFQCSLNKLLQTLAPITRVSDIGSCR